MKEHRNNTTVDGARAPAHERPIAPCRSRSMPSTLSALATMPPTSDISFTAERVLMPSSEADKRMSSQSGRPNNQLRPAVRDQVRITERG
ncbi:hypothetical protein [Streptomyces sp. NPDC048282]|uniref:hypothetical protein n=1 Tax=Streptomyces sp. NPDC048282 TaxID=3365528 RepID=UPI003716EADA